MDRLTARHFIRSQLDRLMAFSGLLRWQKRRMRRGLTILMYHRVLPLEQCLENPLKALVMPVDIFRQQMKWLADHCSVLPVSEALGRLNNSSVAEEPLVAVTFDDGYADNYDLAAPILEAYDLRGTFFVTSDFVATGRPQWYDRAAVAWPNISESDSERLLSMLYRGIHGKEANGRDGNVKLDWMEGLKRAAPDIRSEMVAQAEQLAEHSLEKSLFRPMRPEQVRDLHARGHEIGSHTVSHPILPQLSDDALAAEMQQSANELSTWTGSDIAGFCYPNGDYDVQVERSVFQAGYQYACTTREGLNLPGELPFRLKRLPMTMQRTMRGIQYEPLGFQAELCRARALWRRY